MLQCRLPIRISVHMLDPKHCWKCGLVADPSPSMQGALGLNLRAEEKQNHVLFWKMNKIRDHYV